VNLSYSEYTNVQKTTQITKIKSVVIRQNQSMLIIFTLIIDNQSKYETS